MMSPVMDETAGDLPVRDVGLMKGGLRPTLPGERVCVCVQWHVACLYVYFCTTDVVLLLFTTRYPS